MWVTCCSLRSTASPDVTTSPSVRTFSGPPAGIPGWVHVASPGKPASEQDHESIEWLEKAARRQPEYPEIYKLLGVNYALGGMLKESEKSFRRSVELDPRNWELHYLLGRSLYEADDLKNAEDAFREPSS
jgi:cytochrome c-type biogenesis protein CcmH/NrfG